MEGLAVLYLIAALFAIVLAICWIILPFALIGTKPLLRKLIAETQRTNALLEELAGGRKAPPTPPPAASKIKDMPGWMTNPPPQ